MVVVTISMWVIRPQFDVMLQLERKLVSLLRVVPVVSVVESPARIKLDLHHKQLGASGYSMGILVLSLQLAVLVLSRILELCSADSFIVDGDPVLGNV